MIRRDSLSFSFFIAILTQFLFLLQRTGDQTFSKSENAVCKILF